MATITIPSETAAIELTVDGGDPFEHLHAIPSGVAALAFATSGGFVRKIEIGNDPAAMTFSTSSGSDQVVIRELLAGAGIELQVWDRADPKGTMLERLEFREQKFEWVLSDTGSIEIILPRSYLNSVLAEKDHHIVVLVDGIERARFIAEDLVEVPVSEDERQSVRVVGRGIGACLEWGAVAPYDFGGANQRVKRIWTGATRARALSEIFAEVQARGVLTQVTVDGWNAEHGSTGALWPDLVDLEFDAGGSWLELVQSWTEFGIEWLMTHDLRLQLAPLFGRKLADTVVLYPAHTVRQQELSISRRDIRTVLFTQDGAGGVQRISDAPARVNWGDREQYAVFSDALGAGTASANGYLLLDLIKDAVKERRVEIDPNAPGRRPFVDFDLGDVVGVWFGDDVYEFRVLAIAMSASAETGRIRCEVTLEYMLEAQRRRRQRLLNASSAGGGVSSGPQTVYATGGGADVSTSKISMLPLILTSFVSTLGKLGFTLIGTASTSMTVSVDVMYQENVLETFEYTVPAGVQTIEVTWLWTQIPQGEVPMRLRVWTSTGTFSIGANKAQFWIEAKSIAGRQVAAPVLYVDEIAPPAAEILNVNDNVVVWTPALVTDSVLVDGETVPAAEDVATTTESIAFPLTFVLTAQPSASGEDGWANSSTLTTGSTETFAGNVSGESRSAFYRFVVPIDLTGKTLVNAWLVGTGNAVSSAPITKLYAIDDGDPAAPITLGEFTGAPLTTAYRDWQTATTSGGSVTSPSITNILQELVDSYGTVSSIVIVQKDNGSATNTVNRFRTHDYAPAAGVQLVVQYLEE